MAAYLTPERGPALKMPAKTVGSFSPSLRPNDVWSRDGDSLELPTSNSSHADIVSDGFTALSPPPTLHSSRARPKKLLLRLKSDPGLREHVDGSLHGAYANLDIPQPPVSPISPVSTASGPVMWRSDPHDSIRNSSILSGTARTIREDRLSPALPPLNIFNRDVVKTVIKDPLVVSRLCAFAEDRGGARDIEFLQKVQDYTHAIKTLASTVSTISASFVGLAASSPVDLPADLWKGLNTDLKQVSGSVLPGLGSLLLDAERYVEQRLSAEIYPDFLVSQISQSLLHHRSTSNLARDDLNHSFCLTNPYESDNPVICASEGFFDLTGYSRDDALSRNCRFLQGPNTRYTAISRIRNGLLKGEATTELVLNYCKDGHGFWNLLFIAPLVDSDGVLQYHLGGQIDVSNMLNSKEDLLRLLSAETNQSHSSPPRNANNRPPLPKSDSSGKRSARRSASPQHLRTKPSRTKFFQSFRKQPFDHSLLSPASIPTAMSRSEPDLLASEPSSESWTRARPSATLPKQSEAPSPYSCFLVLQVQPSLRTAKRDPEYQFPVAFCSNASMEKLGVTRQEMLHRDIFDSLAELTSPSVSTKSFRATVHDQLMEGKSLKIDLAVRDHAGDYVSAEKHKKTGMVSFSNWNIFSTEASHAQEGSLYRHEARSTKLASHWTPLKDEDGITKWVVLVLMPALSEAA